MFNSFAWASRAIAELRVLLFISPLFCCCERALQLKIRVDYVQIAIDWAWVRRKNLFCSFPPDLNFKEPEIPEHGLFAGTVMDPSRIETWCARSQFDRKKQLDLPLPYFCPPPHSQMLPAEGNRYCSSSTYLQMHLLPLAIFLQLGLRPIMQAAFRRWLSCT